MPRLSRNKPLPATKPCTKCGKDLPYTAEYFPVREKGKLRAACRECNRPGAAERTRKWAKAHPERAAESQRKYLESHREERLDSWRRYHETHREQQRERDRKRVLDNPEKERARNKAYREANPDVIKAYRQRTRAEQAERNRKWLAANPGKSSEYNKRWAEKHPEKAAAKTQRQRARREGAEGEFTADDLKEQRKRQKGKCFWCGKKLPAKGFHADHVVPLVEGGTNWPYNIVLACQKCNQSKGGKHPMDFAGILF